MEVIVVKKRGKVILALLCAAGMAAGGLGNVVLKQTQAETFQESKKIWVIGDSIASDHDDNSKENQVPITGWGNVLQQFVPKDVTIVNKARSGRSSRSYTKEQVYKEVMKGIAAGDYVIVQFGHNDQKEDPLYTDPTGDSNTEGSFRWYLKNFYIEPAFAKGARVILASSVVRREFLADGKTLGEQIHEGYAKAMKELADEYQAQGKEVYFIDTFGLTKELYSNLGDEATKKLHAYTGLGDSAQIDNTHYSPYGAVCIADMMAKQLQQLGISCCQNIKEMQMIQSDEETLEKNRGSMTKFSWR